MKTSLLNCIVDASVSIKLFVEEKLSDTFCPSNEITKNAILCAILYFL